MGRAHDGRLRVLVVSSGWPSDDQPENSVFVAHQVEALRAAGVEVDVVHYAGETNPRNYLRARRDVRRRLAQGTCDLVHFHFGQSSLVVFPSAMPVVGTFHGSDLFGVVGADGSYSARGRALRRISRWGARRASAVIVPSQRLARQVPDGVRSTVIPIGIDLDTFRPADKASARRELGLPPTRAIVLFSGRRSAPVKRFELARSAVDALHRDDVDLICVEGLTRPELARYMVASDVLLVTSRHESGPLTVKEALACDLRVTSVDVGDVREWIGGLDGCSLCTDDTPDAIAAGLRAALASAGDFDGRSVVAGLAESSLVERVIAVYRDVLEPARGNAPLR